DLFLPASMWNPGAVSMLDANDDLQNLSHLTRLEKLHLSVHFLSNINLQDKGLAHLAPLTGLKELRLAQTKVKGPGLTPFVNLRFVDLTDTPFGDAVVASVEGMTALDMWYMQYTLVTDRSLSTR